MCPQVQYLDCAFTREKMSRRVHENLTSPHDSKLQSNYQPIYPGMQKVIETCMIQGSPYITPRTLGDSGIYDVRQVPYICRLSLIHI